MNFLKVAKILKNIGIYVFKVMTTLKHTFLKLIQFYKRFSILNLHSTYIVDIIRLIHYPFLVRQNDIIKEYYLLPQASWYLYYLYCIFLNLHLH